MMTLTKALNNYDHLNVQIDEYRNQVIQSVTNSGLTSEKKISHSEKLDEAIWDMQVQQQKFAAMQQEQDKKEVEALEEHIDEWREKMIKSAMLYGFTDPETLHCSEQLDTLIFQMQNCMQKSEKTTLGVKKTFPGFLFAQPPVCER